MFGKFHQIPLERFYVIVGRSIALLWHFNALYDAYQDSKESGSPNDPNVALEADGKAQASECSRTVVLIL